jgi:hypothetical protein
MKNGKSVFIGRFNNEIEAACAYDAKAKELFGEFAYTIPEPNSHWREEKQLQHEAQ